VAGAASRVGGNYSRHHLPSISIVDCEHIEGQDSLYHGRSTRASTHDELQGGLAVKTLIYRFVFVSSIIATFPQPNLVSLEVAFS
jgi:hypothetical protein